MLHVYEHQFPQYNMFCKFSTDGDQNPASSRLNLKRVYFSCVIAFVCCDVHYKFI
jgi:hypothetical protein